MDNRMMFSRRVTRPVAVLSVIACVFATLLGARGIEPSHEATSDSKAVQWPAFDPSQPREIPVPAPADLEGRVSAVSPGAIVSRGSFTSVQVNVDGDGNNILGDAANEPTITVDVTNPARMAIAWRQFNTVTNNFRQAGMANTADFGATWNARVLDPGQFRSDPVLASDRNGNFYFSSLSSTTSVELFRSLDGGATWLGPVTAHGGDKQWIAVDRTTGVGSGHIYQIWNSQFSCCPPTDFARSVDAGLSFQPPRSMPQPKIKWGTIDVGPDGTVYMAGTSLGATEHLFLASSNAENSLVIPTFSVPTTINLGGSTSGFGGGPNPGGLLGQVSIATDHSSGPTRGNIYVLASVNPEGTDPLDVMFIRSTDGGQTWSAPLRINDDAPSSTGWQWFGTMAVAPTGRIDVVWNDTRNDVTVNSSELYYSSSIDGGVTWSSNMPITPPFDHFEGYPQQNKIGDYYHMVSDAGGANLAFAATFNDEQDVYYLRIFGDCNLNGVEDALDISNETSADCSDNGIPDECEPDCNGNAAADSCDIYFGTSTDCTNNGLPDECEPDCNTNGQSDLCDIAGNSSPDANHNTIPDECEAILYVRQGAQGKRNGLNWTDAYDNLQAALAHSATPPRVVLQIWVAGGTYVPSSSNRSESFKLQTGLGIYGGFAGNETDRAHRNWHRNPTILSGDIMGNDLPNFVGRSDNSFHVVACENCGAAGLDGFIITGGNADGVGQDASGGGIIMNGGESAILHCAIIDNVSLSQGGGAFVSDAKPYFGDCLFARNASFQGAAIFITRASEVVLWQSTIAHNAASGLGAVAGDLYVVNTLLSGNSIFWGNTDFSENLKEAQITRISTVFLDHSTVEGWSGQYGGTGNNGDDPLFADVNGVDDVAGTRDDNFRLRSGSPAIDTGNVLGLNDYEPDLDAHPRLLCESLDRGAYEFGIGDYDCDQFFDLEDFKFIPNCVLGPVEDYQGDCRTFNFDDDNDVDLMDYALLQVFWSQ